MLVVFIISNDGLWTRQHTSSLAGSRYSKKKKKKKKVLSTNVTPPMHRLWFRGEELEEWGDS